MELQPTLNIGVIGDVMNGKTSLVNSITSTDTKRHKKEKERGHTLKLGYANSKIYKCSTCSEPKCYSSTNGNSDSKKCVHCDSETKLVAHISFVDCPGHDSLMATMLNGTCVMDATILVESVTNKLFPGKQTREHLKVADITNIPNVCVCLNKMDTVKKEYGKDRCKELKKFLNDTSCKDSDIIPISANLNLQVDYVLQMIVNAVEKLKVDRSDDNETCKMIGVRSFNVNKKHIDYKEVKGVVIGGTILKGSLKPGDDIVVYPGNFVNDKYCPISTSVINIHSESNSLEEAHSGGLVAVETTIDPYFGKDKLAGSCIFKGKTNIKVFKTIRAVTEQFNSDKDQLMKEQQVFVNCNAKNIVCTIVKVKKNKIELLGKEALCAEIDDRINISVIEGRTKRLVRIGRIVEGDKYELASPDDFFYES